MPSPSMMSLVFLQTVSQPNPLSLSCFLSGVWSLHERLLKCSPVVQGVSEEELGVTSLSHTVLADCYLRKLSLLPAACLDP